MAKIRVTIWNEYLHEKTDKAVAEVYPEGIHAALAEGLGTNSDISCKTAWLEQKEHGLSEKTLSNTDVLLWWGHKAHDRVDDEIVNRVKRHVLEGMGLIVLHSGHFSKIFRSLMGTNCSLKWREAGEKERLWVVERSHPIAAGLGEYFELPHTEMYGERFDIPTPDHVVFLSWFEGGNVFRSGCTWTRGNGKIFYFRPGHETYPIYRDQTILKVLANAVRWAKRTVTIPDSCPNDKMPLEKIRK